MISTHFSVNLTIVSKKNLPFSAILYTPTGVPFIFKGDKITYEGVVTYLEIQNIHNSENMIKIYISEKEKDVNISFFKLMSSIISIFALISTILLDTKSYLRKILLIYVLIIILDMYISPNYVSS